MLALVGVDLGEGHATMVVHGHEDVLPADVASALSAIAGDPVSNPVEAAELLDVDVQQLARLLALVALHRLGGTQIAQPGQTRSPQDAADRRLGHAQARGDLRLQTQPSA